MSKVIITVLELTFSLIFDKLRANGAEKLQDGDLTDQKFRDWIVRELDDIKSKVDAISKTDLLASISFLKQGVQRLNLAFDESAESEGPSSSELSSAGASSTSAKATLLSVTIEDAVVLASAVGKLKLHSDKVFVLAQKSFEEAGKQATLAFHNAALTIEERILSSQVRIASSILQHLDHTEVAASDCLQYLEELHDVPQIQEIFSVYIGKGMKSHFKRESRAEIVENVTMINLILADFISKFTKRRMAVFDWPQLQCGKQVVHLIHCDEEKVKKTRKIEIKPPWDIVECKSDNQSMGNKYAMNSKGDLIRFCYEEGNICKFDRATKEWQLFLRLNDEFLRKKSIAIGLDDTVYIVSKDDNLQSHTLSAYSSVGENTYRRNLSFIRESPCCIAVTDDNKIVMCCEVSGSFQLVVYICDIREEPIKRFIEQFEISKTVQGPFFMCDNEITVAYASYDLSKAKEVVDFYVYSPEGELKSTFEIKLQSFDSYVNITLDHARKNYTVCSRAISDTDSDKIYIQRVSGAGEFVINAIFLDKYKYNIGNGYCKLVSHRNGVMALVSPERVLYLQSPSK